MALLTKVNLQNLVAVSLGLVAASAGGDTFANAGVILVVQNTDASAKTVTVKSFAPPVPGYAVADIPYVIPPGEIRAIKGFGGKNTRNPDGNVELTYSAVTGLKVGVFE